eukprot:551864-Amphidinium_carterae.1
MAVVGGHSTFSHGCGTIARVWQVRCLKFMLEVHPAQLTATRANSLRQLLEYVTDTKVEEA